MFYLAAVLLGVVAGLRTMTPLAALSWAARLGDIKLGGNRTVPLQFVARIVSGAVCGAAVGHAAGAWTGGAIAGVLGATIGTLGGAWLRRQLASAFRRDRPAALLEDVVAIGGAVLIYALLD
jgi:uncharacterized membrane protein